MPGKIMTLHGPPTNYVSYISEMNSLSNVIIWPEIGFFKQPIYIILARKLTFHN